MIKDFKNLYIRYSIKFNNIGTYVLSNNNEFTQCKYALNGS